MENLQDTVEKAKAKAELLEWAHTRAILKGPLVFDDGSSVFDPKKKCQCLEHEQTKKRQKHGLKGRCAIIGGAADALEKVMKWRDEFTGEDVAAAMSEEQRDIALARSALSRNCHEGFLYVVRQRTATTPTVYGKTKNKLNDAEPVVDSQQ